MIGKLNKKKLELIFKRFFLQIIFKFELNFGNFFKTFFFVNKIKKEVNKIFYFYILFIKNLKFQKILNIFSYQKKKI